MAEITRGKGVLPALNQQVMTPYGRGKLIWFEVSRFGDRIVHVSIGGKIKKLFLSNIKAVSDGETSGVRDKNFGNDQPDLAAAA